MGFDADAFALKTDSVTIGGKDYEFPCDVPADVKLQLLAKAQDVRARFSTMTEDDLGGAGEGFELMRESIATILRIKTPDFDKSALGAYGQETLERIMAVLNGVDPDSPLFKAATGEPKGKKGKKPKKK